MPKKKNIKRILIISIILLVIILAVRALVMDAIERAQMEDKEYTSISDFTSIKEIATYMGCTYIKEEESTSDTYDIDIYLKFKYPLYTDEVSNEDYYYKMIALMIEYLNYQDMRLIDEENDIVIAVTCNTVAQEIETLLINGDSNYFGTRDSQNILENYSEVKTIELNAEADELKKLIENDWNESSVYFGTQESTYNNRKIYFEEGIETRIINKKVFHLVFTENYKNNVVNGINVNTEKESIIETLGEPDFTFTKPSVIGYRGNDFYIFFNLSYKRIDIYRKQSTTTEESEKIKQMLVQLGVDGNATTFLSDITDMWSDYTTLENEDGTIELEYTLRGIKFEVNVSENSGLLLYSNYTGSLMKDLLNGESIPYLYLKDDDLIYEYEVNYSREEKVYKDLNTLNIDIVESTNKSNKFVIVNATPTDETKKLRVISVDGEHYNFDFETKVNSYVWLDDYNFAYSITGKGIYRYNIQNNETQVILEGNEIFELKEYSSGHLYYDDSYVIYVME